MKTRIYAAPAVKGLTAKLFNYYFHSPEVVSRWRDPQLQVGKKYSDMTNGGELFRNLADWYHILCLKARM